LCTCPTHNCVANVGFVEAKITCFSFMETCFLFILHAKIYFKAVLTKHIFLNLLFLKPQLKVFFLNYFFKP
jgi:hypothetical protein